MTRRTILPWVACALAASLALAVPARAERAHTVRAGESLASIARRHRVGVTSLAAANARTPSGALRVGEILEVPPRGVIVLGSGETLWSVAHGHGCSVDALARANDLDATTRLRPGMRLVLPGTPRPAPVRTAHQRTATLASQPSVRRTTGQTPAKLFRIATDEHLTLALTDPRGRVRPQATARLARFLRPRHATKQKRPDRRLVGLLAEIARHYPGRTISVISGYRVAGGYTSKESRHTHGKAIDMRVDGVPVRALRDYLRSFSKVGVGFYPNSDFVHLDVRDKNAYWIDLSSPGRRPSYLDREQREHFDGKNKDEGLAELARSVTLTIDQLEQGEPSEGDADE